MSRRVFLAGSASALALAACNGSSSTTTSTVPATTTAATTTTTAPPPTTTTTEAPPASTTTTTMANGNGTPPAGIPDPTMVGETWADPWVWRPSDDPSDVLNLYVVESLAPIALAGGSLVNGSLSLGAPLLFSYNGTTPGPTIRMRGDQTLYLKLYNRLGMDNGSSTVGPNPDPLRGKGPYPGPEGLQVQSDFKAGKNVYGGTPEQPVLNKIPTEPLPDYCLGEHVNGVHSAHVTNIHTHGLHVAPGRNADNGTYSDDIYLRIVPPGDFLRRTIEGCEIGEQIVNAEADYEFRLGNTPDVPLHPPGTFWYHPHSHGATHNQVAGGMAGFLIVEGDVDAMVNQQLAGEEAPDPVIPTGSWNYRERTVLIQRISIAAQDPDAPVRVTPRQKALTFPVVNGTFDPRIIVMAPGAIERWRVLNGSVDGGGYFRVAVLKGEFHIPSSGTNQGQLVDADGNLVTANDYQPLTVNGDPVEKADISQLAWDGITLVSADGDYFVKDLSGQGEPMLDSIEDCYKAENLQSCYYRANEVAMAPGNRADLFVQAPQLADAGTPEVYTVVGLGTALPGNTSTPLIAAYVVVRGDPVPGAADFDFTNLKLPEVPSYLKPIRDELIQVDPNASGGPYRTRTVRYAGWGSGNYPLVPVDSTFVGENPDLNKLIYYQPPAGFESWPDPATGLPTLVCPPNTRTMSIDNGKFDPDSTTTPRMELGSGEEWAVYNESIELYGAVVPTDPDPNDLPPGVIYYTENGGDPTEYWGGHQVVWPLTLKEALALPGGLQPAVPDGKWKKLVAAVDHPFHIHQNPFWLTRIDVPDEDGNLVNILPEPRWGDTSGIPRNGGRLVFRSLFVDYSGEFVNHCHILLHEDNGMMQRVQIVSETGQANFEPHDEVASHLARTEEVNRVYPPPSPQDSYEQSAVFVDPNPNTGQVFPGFPVPAPGPPPG